ncbi:RDD family protein [soil metagenome]
MTAVLPDTAASADVTPGAVITGAVTTECAGPQAGWLARAGAFGLDILVGIGVVVTLVVVAWSAEQRSWLWWLAVVAAGLVLLAVAVNRLLLPAQLGWSVGRAVFGIGVVRRDGAAVGPWRLLLRDVAHLLDTVALFVGWLGPLWDSRRRTFADLLARTEVHRMPTCPGRVGRWAGLAVTAAALLAVAAAVLSYVVVYQADLRVAQTREQLSVSGPKIVEDMLSYDPATLQPDFERARGLVTDGYRAQLETQQQAIAAAGAVPNEYWTANSAVLTAAADHGTMLLALQGQRGAPPDQRFITATVKVDFEKSGGQWRVGGLTILSSPRAQRPAP